MIILELIYKFTFECINIEFGISKVTVIRIYHFFSLYVDLVSMARLGADEDTVSHLDTPPLVRSSFPSILLNKAVINAPLGSSRLKDAWGERRLGVGATFVMMGPLLVEDKDS